jgi:disulfide bond formation protein DsbB
MNHYNQSAKSLRPMMLLGLFITAAMFGTAMYMQHVMYLDPCPLCIVTRVIVLILAVLFLSALILNPAAWGRRVFGTLFTLSSLSAVIVSSRHSWLQHFPPSSEGSCGPGLNYWMDNLPTSEVIQNVFKGTAECSAVSWTLFGLSIPEWSLLVFLGFLFFSLRLLFKGR